MTSPTSQSAVPCVAQAFSSSSVRVPCEGRDISLIAVIASPVSTSEYPQSLDAVHATYAVSSLTVAVSPALAGASLTAEIVIVMVPVADVVVPSLTW